MTVLLSFLYRYIDRLFQISITGSVYNRRQYRKIQSINIWREKNEVEKVR